MIGFAKSQVWVGLGFEVEEIRGWGSSRLRKLEVEETRCSIELELELGALDFWSRRWRQASGAKGTL